MTKGCSRVSCGRSRSVAFGGLSVHRQRRFDPELGDPLLAHAASQPLLDQAPVVPARLLVPDLVGAEKADMTAELAHRPKPEAVQLPERAGVPLIA